LRHASFAAKQLVVEEEEEEEEEVSRFGVSMR
jgi:hypothetical protein